MRDFCYKFLTVTSKVKATSFEYMFPRFQLLCQVWQLLGKLKREVLYIYFQDLTFISRTVFKVLKIDWSVAFFHV